MAPLPLVEEFLKECARSGDAAYAAFKSLLERLDHPDTRYATRVFLAELQSRFGTEEAGDECFRTYHFRIRDVFLTDYEGSDIIMLDLVECGLFSILVSHS